MKLKDKPVVIDEVADIPETSPLKEQVDQLLKEGHVLEEKEITKEEFEAKEKEALEKHAKEQQQKLRGAMAVERKRLQNSKDKNVDLCLQQAVTIMNLEMHIKQQNAQIKWLEEVLTQAVEQHKPLTEKVKDFFLGKKSKDDVESK